MQQTLASYHEVGIRLVILKSPFESVQTNKRRLLTFSGTAAAGDKDDDRIDIIPIIAQLDTNTIDGSALNAQDGTALWTPITSITRKHQKEPPGTQNSSYTQPTACGGRERLVQQPLHDIRPIPQRLIALSENYSHS